MAEITQTGIYAITNSLNNKRYIGSSANIFHRLKEHRYLLQKNKHTNGKLQNAWNKYGGEIFLFNILEMIPINKLIKKEQYWIDKINSVKNGYNIRPTAESNLGFRFSEESKKKISMNNGNKGKAMSEETKKKISEANKGKKRSEETKRKISLNSAHLSGKNHPMFGIRRYGKDNPFFGKHFSEEMKKKLSESCKGKVHTKEYKEHMSKVMKGIIPWNTGKHLSEEHKERLSLATKKYWDNKKSEVIGNV
jgi:group I intron endonuclease